MRPSVYVYGMGAEARSQQSGGDSRGKSVMIPVCSLGATCVCAAVCAPRVLNGSPPIPSTHQECSRFDAEERRKGGGKNDVVLGEWEAMG